MFKKTQGCFKPLKLTVAFKEIIYNYVVLSNHYTTIPSNLCILVKITNTMRLYTRIWGIKRCTIMSIIIKVHSGQMDFLLYWPGGRWLLPGSDCPPTRGQPPSGSQRRGAGDDNGCSPPVSGSFSPGPRHWWRGALGFSERSKGQRQIESDSNTYKWCKLFISQAL